MLKITEGYVDQHGIQNELQKDWPIGCASCTILGDAAQIMLEFYKVRQPHGGARYSNPGNTQVAETCQAHLHFL